MRFKRVAQPIICVALAAVAPAVTACSANAPFSAPPGTPPVPQARHDSTTPIKHVIFIIQENRSFNNLFMGYPGAKTQNYGYDSNGYKIVLQAENLAEPWDLDHFSSGFFASCNGKGALPGTRCRMNGWNNVVLGRGAPKNAPYSYVPEAQVDQYWQMAKQYVLGDRMFASNLDGSFIAHQYIVAAYASRAVDSAYGAWGCEGGSGDNVPTLTDQRTYGTPIVACFNNPTIGSEADAAGVTWRFYTGAIFQDGGIWSSYQADRQIYKGPDWTTRVINPPSEFLTDVGHGKLANITWITPTYANSDHPGQTTSGGPAWVTSIVNAVGESRFWKSSAIFIMWDDWGGWFDPVKPPFKDYDGLGFRVPLIVISPYAKKGYVTHVQYETASVVRFMEGTFGLPPMAAADSRANDPAIDAFDYLQTPRPFKRFAGARPDGYWVNLDRGSRLQGRPASFIGDD
jgi:phospholipase C